MAIRVAKSAREPKLDRAEVVEIATAAATAAVANALRSGAEAKRGRPASGKVVVTLRLEPEIIERFKATGPGWQARMNDVLRRNMP